MTITLKDCTANGVAVTAENFKSLLVSTSFDGMDPSISSTFLADATIIVNGVAVQW